MRRFLLLICALLALNAQAQDSTQVFRFGYLSYGEALKSMADYAIVTQQMADLKAQYQAETLRVEDEFNRKYEEFLDGQADFAPTILQKRQSELQELLTKNVAFKAESERLLRQAESDTYAPIREKLQNAIRKVGAEQGYAFILNTDGDACPYIDPEMGEDVTELVIEAMK